MNKGQGKVIQPWKLFQCLHVLYGMDEQALKSEKCPEFIFTIVIYIAAEIGHFGGLA